MLPLIQDIVFFQICHNIADKYMTSICSFSLEHMYTCQLYRSVICGVVFFSFLEDWRIGETLAVRQSSGISPVSVTFEKFWLRLAQFVMTIRGDMPSGPVAFFGFKFVNNFSTPF